MRSLSVMVAGMLVAGVAGFTGCAFLNPGTTTKDGDVDMKLPEYKGVKHAVGCKNFTCDAGWESKWSLGNNLSIMLEFALKETGRFVLVEREQLKEIIAEQDLAASGRAAKAKDVAKTGVIRPAKYLATGQVVTAEEGASGGGAGISIGPLSLGGASSKAALTIIAKLVDTSTGEIVKEKRIMGRAGRVGANVGLNLGIVSTQTEGFRKTPMGDAAQDCINQAAKFFAETIEKLPFEGCVVTGAKDQVVINRGAEFGLEVGKVLSMEEEGEMLYDPQTGAALDRKPGKVLGKLKITRVGPKTSVCAVTEGEQNPKVGTLVLEVK